MADTARDCPPQVRHREILSWRCRAEKLEAKRQGSGTAPAALAEASKPDRQEDSLTPAEWYLLFDECREKKESLHPKSRKITIDLERVRTHWREVSVSVDPFYEECRPLVERSREVVEDLLATHPEIAQSRLHMAITPSTLCT